MNRTTYMPLSGPIRVIETDEQIMCKNLRWKDSLIEQLSNIPITDAAYKLWIHEKTILITGMRIVDALQQAHKAMTEEECNVIIQFAIDFHLTLSRLFEQEYALSGDEIDAAAKAIAQVRGPFRGFAEETYLQAERYMNIDSDIVPWGKNSKGQ